jgi:hypothetical protein
MAQKRIQVYADEETKRRVELAAAQHEVAVTAYCLAAIKQQLLEDDLLESDTVEIAVKPARETSLVAELRALQQEIKAHRKGKPIDVDRVMNQLREEREHELSRLH